MRTEYWDIQDLLEKPETTVHSESWVSIAEIPLDLRIDDQFADLHFVGRVYSDGAGIVGELRLRAVNAEGEQRDLAVSDTAQITSSTYIQDAVSLDVRGVPRRLIIIKIEARIVSEGSPVSGYFSITNINGVLRKGD